MTPLSDSVTVLRARFRALHASGCVVMPNPWDVGSARVLEGVGFRALATTSAGMAWAHGCRDHGVAVEDVLAHLRAMADAVAVPVNADFEAGFATAPDQVARYVRAAAMTGIAGLSIEDSTGEARAPLFERSLAIERVRAARAALDELGGGLVLTARSEGFIAGQPDLPETIGRLVAYAEAGADCLYAPGLRTIADIRAVVNAVAPKPVNVLVSSSFTSVAELADAGVRRISVGGALSRVAWAATLAAAREILEQGTFTSLDAAAPPADINGRFPESRVTRQ